MKHAIKWGLILGGISVVQSLIMWKVAPQLFFNTTMSMVVGGIITVVILVLALKEQKSDSNGFLSFGDGLKTSFVALLIGTLLSGLFIGILFDKIDPSLKDQGVEYSKKVAKKTFDMIANLTDMPEAEKAKAIAEMESPEQIAKMKRSFGLSSMFLGSLIGVIFPGFLYWLIIPAVMKGEGTYREEGTV